MCNLIHSNTIENFCQSFISNIQNSLKQKTREKFTSIIIQKGKFEIFSNIKILHG